MDALIAEEDARSRVQGYEQLNLFELQHSIVGYKLISKLKGEKK
jgi:hypothetical protein